MLAHDILMREKEESLKHKCPFCRTPSPESNVEILQYIERRVSANDPVASCQRGKKHYGEKNFSRAFELWTKAAKLGDIEAHHELACSYASGEGVEKDEKKEIHHLEEAAIGGHPDARFMLGINEGRVGRFDRAIKHMVIAANMGYDISMEELKECFGKGFVKKEDLAAALRAHKAAVDATESPQREAAEQYFSSIEQNG